MGASIIAVSLPSSQENCAKNFVNGIPNSIVILEPGKYYHFNNLYEPKRAFPSIYIPSYNGTPIPVVDKTSGELVTVLTNCNSWDPDRPSPNVGVVADDSSIGITTDDPNYDIVIGGFYIENTGFQYTNPTLTVTTKRDDDKPGKVVDVETNITLHHGRIVDIELINKGSGFKRIPEIKITDETGYGAVIRPIMSVISVPGSVSQYQEVLDVIYCPAKSQTNLL